MAFVSNKSKSAKKNNLPDNQLVIKVPTSKGFITLGKLGLYDESALHSQVAKLSSEQLVKLLGKAEVSVVPYESANEDDPIQILID